MTDVLAATERNKNILSGAIGLLLLSSAIVLGVKYSFGAFDSRYQLQGSFAAAGQGLLDGSDVKIRGVNVGEVASIELVDNRALITLDMKPGIEVPATASAVIRPKTLFGEKFVDIDPGADETSGPFLGDGDTIENTLGGFELEQVLVDTFPVLEAIDPAELAVVVDELAESGAGLGPNINQTLVNTATLTRLMVDNDAEFRRFTGDLALLTEELERVAPSLLTGARNLNAALPTINSRSGELADTLRDLSRVSTDLADLFENNEEFLRDSVEIGGRGLQLLFDKRSQIQPLLTAIIQYTSTTAEAVRIPVGNGTFMAAVKGVSGGQICEGVECDTGGGAGASADGRGGTGLGSLVDDLVERGIPTREASTGADAIAELFGAVLGR